MSRDLMRMAPGDRLPSLISGDSVCFPQDTGEMRMARCTVADPADFLGKIRAVSNRFDTHIICFNADKIAGSTHAQVAMQHAVRAYENKNLISNSLEMEALLYAAGSRQCSIASAFGIHEGENSVYVCCYPGRPGIWEALEPLFRFCEDFSETITPEKRARLMDLFSISGREIEAAGGAGRILDLVLERVALLEISK